MQMQLQSISFLAALVAASLAAQVEPSKSVSGTVAGFKMDAAASEILVKPDRGEPSAVKFGPGTEVLRIAPGERDLSKAEAAHLTDIVPGDRILVSFAEGMPEARRIVLITAVDLARRNEAYRQDWRERGIGGVVVSKNGNEIALRAGPETVAIVNTDSTIVRRYTPGSVKFADARLSNIGDVAPGDQLQARGDKTADGIRIMAEEIVFGTFITTAGKITEVDPTTNRITVQDLATAKPLTIHLTADSRLKMVPDMQTTMNRMHVGNAQQSPASGERPGMAQMIDRLLAASIGDLKPGGTVVVTSTKGERSDEVTAILLLANAEFVVRMMGLERGGPAPNGMPSMDEILKRHGMNGGATSGGFNLPTIIP
jgi:hypothetical protein